MHKTAELRHLSLGRTFWNPMGKAMKQAPMSLDKTYDLAIDENVMRNEILSTWNALSSETRAPLTQCNACGTIGNHQIWPFCKAPLGILVYIVPTRFSQS